MGVLYLEIAVAFAVLHYVPLVLGLAYPSEMELLLDDKFSRAERLKFLARGLVFYGLFWPVVAFLWLGALIHRALAELVLFVLKVTGFYQRRGEFSLERTEPTLDAIVGWLKIISFVAAVAAAWLLVPFIWRAFVSISDK